MVTEETTGNGERNRMDDKNSYVQAGGKQIYNFRDAFLFPKQTQWRSRTSALRSTFLLCVSLNSSACGQHSYRYENVGLVSLAYALIQIPVTGTWYVSPFSLSLFIYSVSFIRSIFVFFSHRCIALQRRPFVRVLFH